MPGSILYGLDSQRESIRKILQFMWDNEKRAVRKRLAIQPTILIYGSPGTGKTSLIQNLALEFKSKYNEEGFHYMKTNLNSLLSHNLGQSSKNLNEFFNDLIKKAKQEKRVLIHLDDAESALTSRMDGSESKGVFRFVTTALGKLDALIGADLMYSPVIVLSTNMIKVLDPAVDRRFTHRFRFEPTLTDQHIRELSSHYLADSIDEYSDFVEALISRYDPKQVTPHQICRILEVVLVQGLAPHDAILQLDEENPHYGMIIEK